MSENERWVSTEQGEEPDDESYRTQLLNGAIAYGIVYDIQAEPCSLHVGVNCRDGEAETIKAAMDTGNVWSWCDIAMTGHLRGVTSALSVSAEASIGGQSFADERSFRDSPVAKTMQERIKRQIQAQVMATVLYFRVLEEQVDLILAESDDE